MSNVNTPRLPVRFIETNQDLLKAQLGEPKETTDYSEDMAVDTVTPWPHHEYRVPSDRPSGNSLFRRYTNGSLDYEYATHKVVDVLHKVKDSGGVDVLNHLEHVTLSVLFPESFYAIDSSMVSHTATVQLKLSPMEVASIRLKVAAHLAEEMHWNAGYGG